MPGPLGKDYRNRMFECAICLQDMIGRTPKALPCLHTFCMECIRCVNMTDNKLKCPTCRKVCHLDHGVEELPVNFHFSNVLLKTKQSHSNCDLCLTAGKQVKVSHSCEKCNIAMCETCTQTHEERFGGTHKIKIYSYKIPRCQEHDSDNIQFYCEICRELICALCVFHGLHTSHDIIHVKEWMKHLNIPDIVKDKMHILASLSGLVEQKLEDSKVVKEQIKHSGELMKGRIDKQINDLLEQCETECEEPLTEAMNKIKQFEQDLEEMKELFPDAADSVLVMNTILNVNKNVTDTNRMNLKSLSFFPKEITEVGDVETSNADYSLEKLKVKTDTKFQKDLQIEITDDIPLHVGALEDGGVVYAGSKTCKFFNHSGNCVTAFDEIARKDLLDITVQNEEICSFYEYNIRKQKLYLNNVEHIGKPDFKISHATFTSVKDNEYVSTGNPPNSLFRNGKEKFAYGLKNATCLTSYQGADGKDTRIIVAAHHGKVVKMFDMSGELLQSFKYKSGTIIQMSVKGHSSLIVLNDKKNLEEVDLCDGSIINDSLLGSQFKDNITRFSYSFPYLWVIFMDKLIRFK